MPRKAHQFFSDFNMNYVFLGMLGGAYYGLADLGTALAIIDQTQDGNPASAFAALTSTGELVRARAETALAAGHRATARESFLQSSNYTFAATYFCDGMGAPEKLIPTWKRSRTAMDAAFALFNPTVEEVKVPYEGTMLPGYIFKVDDSGKPRPLLIMTNGSDGSVLDMWLFGAAAGVARGYNCLAVDGPGQGAALWEQHLPFRPDWEKVITPVVDHLLTRPDVDAGKVALLGVSQAGYWVPRSVAFERRIAAAVADPGVVDISTTMTGQVPHFLVKMIEAGEQEKFDKDMALALKFSPATRSMMAFRMRPYGTTSPYEFFTAARAYALTDEVIGRITCPVLVTDPDHEQFWPGQSRELYDKLPAAKALIRFTEEEGADSHCEPAGNGLRGERIFDWLDQHIPA